jgi:hypothetical protein
MANTLTSVKQTRGEFLQFQGAFSDVWTVEATVTDQDAVLANAIGEFDITVTGVAFGDMVLGISVTKDLDDGTDQALFTAHVAAADTVTVQLHADDGTSFAADDLNTTTVKFIVARPAW